MKNIITSVLIACAVVSYGQNIWFPATGTDIYVSNVANFGTNYTNKVAFIKFQNTNTTSATINISSTGAQGLRMWDGDSWEPLTAGQINTSVVYRLSHTGSYYTMYSTGSGSSSLTVGTTAISGGNSGRVLYDNAGVLGEYATVPIANGGTNASTQSTNGVAYFDGTSMTTDATKFYWDGSRLKIQNAGTAAANPQSGTLLHLVSQSNTFNSRISNDSYILNGVQGAVYQARTARGTIASPSASQTDDIIGALNGVGYKTTGFGTGGNASITFLAGSTMTDTNAETYINFSTTANGSTTLTPRFRVGSAGQWGIGASPSYGSANAIFTSGGSSSAPSWTSTGTGVLTALGVNVGSAGAPVLFNGALGTPSSGTLTNATGLPPTTGISGWPANASGVLTNNGSGTLSWGTAGLSGSGTTNELAYWTSSSALGSLTTTTYPSLTELSYVKGLRLSAQTQIDRNPFMYVPPTATLNWFGDSYVAGGGTGASTTDLGMFTQLTNEVTPFVAANNYAVGGTGSWEAIYKHYQNVSVGTTRPAIVHAVFNDARRGGSASKTLEKIKSCFRALIANQFLTSAVAANSGSVSATGSWSTTSGIGDKASLNLGGLVRTSTTAGSTLTFSPTLLAGESIVIGTFSTDEVTTVGGDFTYTVDGGSPISYSGKNKTDGQGQNGDDTGSSSNSIVPNAIIITGLSAGSHTVVVTTSTTTIVRIDYFGVMANSRAVAPIMFSGTQKLTPTGYATGTGLTNGSDAVFDAINTAVLEVINEFSSSFPIYFNDFSQYWNPYVHIGADNVHPNDAGYFQLFQILYRKIKGSAQMMFYGVKRDQNAQSIFRIENATSGTAGRSTLALSTGAGTFALNNLSAGFTTSGINEQGKAVLAANHTNGMNVGTNAASPLQLWTNTNVRFQIASGGGIATGTTANGQYRTTNGGSDVTAHMFIDPANSQTSGDGHGFSTADGEVYTLANGTRRIAGAAIKLVNKTTTAGSEVADIGILTKASGGAIAQRIQIGSTGVTLSVRHKEVQGADVASVAGAIAVGTDGNTFEITGTNAITLISNTNWQNGSKITLLFTSTATLTDGTANSGTDIGMELAGNANFVASADDVVTLVLSEIGGTQRWREVSRSVN